jgi:hypothetical protein
VQCTPTKGNATQYKKKADAVHGWCTAENNHHKKIGGTPRKEYSASQKDEAGQFTVRKMRHAL